MDHACRRLTLCCRNQVSVAGLGVEDNMSELALRCPVEIIWGR
jgi:hypothetical protein